MAGRISGAGETTLRRRRDEWDAAGVFDRLCTEALNGYHRIIGVDLSEVAIDGSQHKAPFGGEGTGPNPTDRGKSGWKWSIATDRHGIPIGWAIDGANRHDCALFAPTLASLAERDLLADIETLHLDRGYDNGVVRRLCAALGLDLVCARKRKKGTATVKQSVPLGMRWPANEPTAGYRTSGSCAATPTATPATASPNSSWPSPSSSPSSSSNGPTDGTHPNLLHEPTGAHSKDVSG
ncbi:MAG: transposase [Acidimicrobiales bacterium]|nr:transposase [Acidimicrobiales bacterium]